MKKTLLLLTSLLTITSCSLNENSKNYISSSKESFDSSSLKSDNSLANFSLPVLNQDCVLELIKKYNKENGFSMTANYINDEQNSITVTTKINQNLFYCKTIMQDTVNEYFYDFTSEQTFYYVLLNNLYYRYNINYSFETALPTLLAFSIPPLIAFQNYNTKIHALVETTYLNQPCYLCKNSIVYSEHETVTQEWYISKKDNLTLKAESKSISNNETTTTNYFELQEIAYTASISLPTQFEIINL